MIKKLILTTILFFTSILNSAHKSISLPYPVCDLSNPMSTASILAGEMKFAAEQKSVSEQIVISKHSYLYEALKDVLPVEDIQKIIVQYLDSIHTLKHISDLRSYIYSGYESYHDTYSIIQLQDGKIASCSKRSILIWDLQIKHKDKLIERLIEKDQEFYPIIKVIQTNEHTLVCCHNNEIKIWDLRIKKCIATITSHDGAITSIIQLRDGRIAYSSKDHTIKILNSGTIDTLEGHAYDIHSIIQLNDGNLASCSDDFTIKIWDLKTNKCIDTLTDRKNIPHLLLQSAKGKLVSYSNHGKIQLWDLDIKGENKCYSDWSPHKNIARSIIKLNNGNMIASCTTENEIKIWDLNINVGNKCFATFQKKKGWSIPGMYGGPYFSTMTQLKDGTLALGTNEGDIELWGTEFQYFNQPIIQEES